MIMAKPGRPHKLTFERLYKENLRRDFPDRYKEFTHFYPRDIMTINLYHENGDIYTYDADNHTLTNTGERWYDVSTKEKVRSNREVKKKTKLFSGKPMVKRRTAEKGGEK